MWEEPFFPEGLAEEQSPLAMLFLLWGGSSAHLILSSVALLS